MAQSASLFNYCQAHSLLLCNAPLPNSLACVCPWFQVCPGYQLPVYSLPALATAPVTQCENQADRRINVGCFDKGGVHQISTLAPTMKEDPGTTINQGASLRRTLKSKFRLTDCEIQKQERKAGLLCSEIPIKDLEKRCEKDFHFFLQPVVLNELRILGTKHLANQKTTLL